MRWMTASPFRLDNLISAIVGGLVGGLLVWGLAPEPSKAAAHAVTVSPSASSKPLPARKLADATGKRLQRLENSMRGVQQRLVEQAKVDVYQEGGNGKGKRITLNAADPKFQTAVRSVIDKAKWEAEQVEQDKRDERRDIRITRQVDALATELNLSDEQAEQVESVYLSRAETLRSLRDGDNRPITGADWRTQFTQVQAETRKKLAAVLDQEQLASYDRFQEQQGFGPWSGRPKPPP